MPVNERDYMRERATYDPKVFRRPRGGRTPGSRPFDAHEQGIPPALRRSTWTWLAIAAISVAVLVYERRANQPTAQRDARDTPPTNISSNTPTNPQVQAPAHPHRTTPGQGSSSSPAAPALERQPASSHRSDPPATSNRNVVSDGPPTAFLPAQPQNPWTSVYLCRSWQGAEFWSSTTCQDVQASILRIHRVSSALPWPQQVAIAQQERLKAEALLRR